MADVIRVPGNLTKRSIPTQSSSQSISLPAHYPLPFTVNDAKRPLKATLQHSSQQQSQQQQSHVSISKPVVISTTSASTSAIQANNKAISQLLRDSKSAQNLSTALTNSNSAKQLQQPPRLSLEFKTHQQVEQQQQQQKKQSILLISSTEEDRVNSEVEIDTACCYSTSSSPLVKGRMKQSLQQQQQQLQYSSSQQLSSRTPIIKQDQHPQQRTSLLVVPRLQSNSNITNITNNSTTPTNRLQLKSQESSNRRSCTAAAGAISSKRRSLLASIAAPTSTSATHQSTSSFFSSTPTSQLPNQILSESRQLKKHSKHLFINPPPAAEISTTSTAADFKTSYGITPFMSNNFNKQTQSYSTFDEDQLPRDKSRTTIQTALSNKRQHHFTTITTDSLPSHLAVPTVASMSEMPQQSQRASLLNSTYYNTASHLAVSNTGYKSNRDKKFTQQLQQLQKIINVQNSPSHVNIQSSLADIASTAEGSSSICETKQFSGGAISINRVKESEEQMENTTQFYEASLHKELPNAFTEAPSSRSDVVTLKKWVTTSLAGLQKQSNNNASSKAMSAEVIYSLACKELLRQISVECFERGDLFQQVIQQSKVILEEKLEESGELLQRVKRNADEELAKMQKKYEEIFRAKEYEMAIMNENSNAMRKRLDKCEVDLEEYLQKNKHLRDSLKTQREIIDYMKKKFESSNQENTKLRAKLAKGQQMIHHNSKHAQVQLQVPHFQDSPNKMISSTASQQVKLQVHDTHNTSINSEYRNNSFSFKYKQMQQMYHFLLLCSLFGTIENHASEKHIEIEGVSETIDNLNYVPFTNPDDIKKQAVAQMQTGVSLLEFCGIVAEQEIQTDLMEIMDEKYDGILLSKQVLDSKMAGTSTIEAQVEYLKNRELQLLQEIESIKAEKAIMHARYSQQSDGSPSLSSFATPKYPMNNTQSTFTAPTLSLSLLTLPRVNNASHSRKVSTQQQRSVMSLSVASSNEGDSDSSSSDHEKEVEDELDVQLKPTKNSKNKPMGTKIQQNNRQLGEKTGQVESLFNDVGRSIVEKARANKFLKFRNFMPLPTVMKQIHLIYMERVRMTNENARVKDQECANFTYFFLTKLYGFKKIVDQKFIIFILSVKKYLNVFRVHLFARFMGLLDAKSTSANSFSVDEFNKYTEVFNYVHNVSTVGIAPSTYDNDSRYLVPFIRIMAFISNFADTRMTLEENAEFKKEIESLKEVDPKGVHTNGLADFDVFLSKMLQKYRQLVNRAKAYVINAFAASDLDGNGVCNLDEFLILNRHIEADRYDEEYLAAIFAESADKIVDEEANLSFDRFAVVCVEHNLFSDQAQDAFLGVRHKREIDFKMQELQAEWIFRKRELLTLFDSLKLISLDSKNKWLEIIEVLCEKLQSVKTAEIKPLLIAYRILQNESKMLLAQEDECRKDDDILEKYEKQAMQEQQMQNMQLVQTRNMIIGLSGNSPDPRNSPGRRSYRSSFGSIQMQNELNSPSSVSSTTSLQDTNLLDQAYENIKITGDREQYLLNILSYNGSKLPSEEQTATIKSLLEMFSSNTNIANTKQTLLGFLKSALER